MSNFLVEFRNQTDRVVTVKTVAFSNPLVLNNGAGFTLSPSGTSGSKMSATFSGDGSRVIVFWDTASGEVLALQEQFLTADFNTFVILLEPPGGSGFLISVGAISPN